jgi:hypothetical protein
MEAIERMLGRIYQDIVRGKNIEAYGVSGLAIVLAVLGVIGEVVSQEILLAAMLAALSLLVFHLTVPSEGKTNIDDILRDRSDFKSPFRELLYHVEKLYVYAPSASSLFNGDYPAHMRSEILEKGGEIQVVLQDPKEEAALTIIEKQLDETTEYSVEDMRPSLKNTIERLERMIQWKVGKIEYRLLPFSPGFSLVAIDPHKSSGMLIIEFHGFQNKGVTQRMHIEIKKEESPYWFEYWIKQFESMWQAARIPEKIQIKSEVE